jgi:hypothetical protein
LQSKMQRFESWRPSQPVRLQRVTFESRSFRRTIKIDDEGPRNVHCDRPPEVFLDQWASFCRPIYKPSVDSEHSFRPTKPASFRPRRNPRRQSLRASGDLGSRSPITRIALLLRAPSGHQTVARPSVIRATFKGTTHSPDFILRNINPAETLLQCVFLI